MEQDFIRRRNQIFQLIDQGFTVTAAHKGQQVQIEAAFVKNGLLVGLGVDGKQYDITDDQIYRSKGYELAFDPSANVVGQTLAVGAIQQ